MMQQFGATPAVSGRVRVAQRLPGQGPVAAGKNFIIYKIFYLYHNICGKRSLLTRANG